MKNDDTTKGKTQAIVFMTMKSMLFVEAPKVNDVVSVLQDGVWRGRRSHTFVDGGGDL